MIRYIATEAYSTNKATDRAKESYDKIVCRIRDTYCNTLADLEADAAARNLIGFCKMLVDYKIKEDVKHKKIK